ncbi:site-specific integrase [Halomonas sp. M5N1S17]|uniref:site-specific integrase n=1 Tax=Halomonas alkalisoli TaxID=2907158 RepID=UPI001F256C59|nr:site-specific integrase [Halomonas alkalisoli]MCE9666138.1 site-specific integrase [Halomonas alkalisoli]
MHTKNLKLSHGETLPTLLDEDGVPDFWVTAYITVKCRPASTFNTLRNITSRLRHLRDFERETGRDFITEFEKGLFLDDKTCNDLRWYCWVDIKRYSTFQKNRGKPRRKKNLVSLIKAEQPPRVDVDTCVQRLRDITKFLVFVAETINANRLHNNNVRRCIDEMRYRLVALTPKTSSSRGALDPFSIAPHPKVFLKLIELSNPDNPKVPFRGITRKRNALMFKVLLATGMRIGELLCLRTDSRHLDLLASPPMIHIRKPSKNDAHIDERNVPPAQKTTERSIYISERLAAEIEDYMMQDRRAATPSRKHNWLFVNHRKDDHWGKPVSLVNWNNAVGRIKKVDLKMFHGLKTHGFRHAFAYIWNKKVDAHNAQAKANPELGMKIISERERESALMDVMGWTRESSAAPYLKRYVKEAVDKVTMEGVDELMEYVDMSIIGGDQ